MTKKIFLTEVDLAAKAKEVRIAAGKRKIQVAREFGVSHPCIYSAEERPDRSLNKMRIRMIETYSKYKVIGPIYYLK